MTPRLFVDAPLLCEQDLSLPSSAARHVQVLRLQPGAPLRLFDGRGGEWLARVRHIGRSEVAVRIEAKVEEGAGADLELATAVTLAIGMPANERMDAVVEKATELGVFAIQPLICERSVLRLAGERADKKVAHWQAVAVAACEQCGRNQVPQIRPVAVLREWLRGLGGHGDGDGEGEDTEGGAGNGNSNGGDGGSGGASQASRWVLSLREATPVAAMRLAGRGGVICLSGPEGGLSEAEEDLARRHGFVPVSLGLRVLRADTAPLAMLAFLALRGDAAG